MCGCLSAPLAAPRLPPVLGLRNQFPTFFLKNVVRHVGAAVTLARYCFFPQSEIEETLERIKNHSGVEGYVIVNNAGEVLRKLPSLSTERAKEYGDEVMKLAKMARHVVRDLDPKVCAHRRGLSCAGVRWDAGRGWRDVIVCVSGEVSCCNVYAAAVVSWFLSRSTNGLCRRLRLCGTFCCWPPPPPPPLLHAQNDIQYLRLRTKEKEVLVAPGTLTRLWLWSALVCRYLCARPLAQFRERLHSPPPGRLMWPPVYRVAVVVLVAVYRYPALSVTARLGCQSPCRLACDVAP